MERYEVRRSPDIRRARRDAQRAQRRHGAVYGDTGGPGNYERIMRDDFEDEYMYQNRDSEESRSFRSQTAFVGDFSGRGPKGYSRSDERIREDVCEQLTRSSSIDASGIEVKVSDGEVILTGTVSARRIKRMVEDIADEILGVKDVRNQIRIV